MKKFQGKVVSKKTDKTAIVRVEYFHVHPIYEKRLRRNKRYPVNDTIGVQEGDMVEFVSVRPISKTKRWQIKKIIPQAGKKGVQNLKVGKKK